MTPTQHKLTDLFKEMFQRNQSDLDFGIYRMMNAKANEISPFLEKDLVGSIRDALLQRSSNSEDSFTQFKVNIANSEKLAQELAAFSNAYGGIIIVGIENEDIRRPNQPIGNVMNANSVPPVYPIVKIENLNNKKVLIVAVSQGANKPYATNQSICFTKAGSDKRKISPEEPKRLFAESNKLYPDEEPIIKSILTDIDPIKPKKFLKKDNPNIWNQLDNGDRDKTIVLENLELPKDGHLTLAGNILFGEDPQRLSPSRYVDCCYFDGNNVSTTGGHWEVIDNE